MEVATATVPVTRSHRWTCVDCGCRVWNVDGKLIDRPRGWQDDHGGMRCIQCTRLFLRDNGLTEERVAYELKLGVHMNDVCRYVSVAPELVKKVRAGLIADGAELPHPGREHGGRAMHYEKPKATKPKGTSRRRSDDARSDAISRGMKLAWARRKAQQS